MSSGHVLTSEPVLGVLCSVLAALWGFFKSSAWWDRLRRRRFGKALRAIEALQREYDAEVVTVVVMVDRLQGGRANLAAAGFELTALFDVAELGVGAADQG